MYKPILITGAAGKVGRLLREAFVQSPFPIFGVDRKVYEPLSPHETIYQADLEDLQTCKQLLEGKDTVIHLAGCPHDGSLEEMVRSNVTPTFNIFEAARWAGVRRVIYASTNQVVNFYPTTEVVSPEMLPRPSSLYGVSKCFGENLGRMYADAYGLEVASLRIGTLLSAPLEPRHLRTWVSPRDLVTAFLKTLEAPSFTYISFFAVSNNAQTLWQSPDAERIGYQPKDNAEDYAATLVHPGHPHDVIWHGGQYCTLKRRTGQGGVSTS